MFAFKDLQSLLDISIKWEKQLKDLYDVAEIGIRKEKSKELIQYLLKKQTAILDVLINIDVNKYGRGEFIKFTPEDHTEELIPQHEITGNTEPDRIISLIKTYESRLKHFYMDISDQLVSTNQKELFDSLVTLKEAQLEALDNYIRQHVHKVT